MIHLKFSQFKLNKIFYLIIFFSVILPILISAGLLFFDYKREIKISEEASKRTEQQVLLNLNLLFTSIKLELNSTIQNPDIIELLNTKQEFRRFIENRVFGKIQEISRKISIPLQWNLYNNDFTQIILSSSKENRNYKNKIPDEGFSVQDEGRYLFVRMDILLDDQSLSGPNSNRKGSLLLIFKNEDIANFVPELIKVKNLDKQASFQSLSVETHKSNSNENYILISILSLGFILIISIILGLYLMRSFILVPINKMVTYLTSKSNSSFKDNSLNELQALEDAIFEYIKHLEDMEHEKAQKIRLEIMSQITRQVAHDIRSPLSALNMVSGSLTEVEEEKRLLIRNATQRINDIANQLIEKSKPVSVEKSNTKVMYEEEGNNNLSTELLSSLIDSIVSEKRVQFREKQNIEIEADINKSYGLFAQINVSEFQRVISNLINNSVEAIGTNKGLITIAIRGYKDLVNIIIQDNGGGIPEEILRKIGGYGVSHGKSNSDLGSGSGLGVYHAKKTIESFGGAFDIISKENVGTSITISLPIAPSPKWFVQSIILNKNTIMISLDDDQAIHQIWKRRLNELFIKLGIEVRTLSFTSGMDFKNWVSQNYNMGSYNQYIFLIDYELIGQDLTGLKLIESLKISKSSYLVTSRFDELDIRNKCEKLGIQIIPKTMAGFVPFLIK